MPTAPKTFRWAKPTPRPRDNRPSASKRGYDRTWQRLRLMFLRQHPLCSCGACATEVDHIVAIARGGERLDEANLQPMCHSCHSRKTARDDGGFKGSCNTVRLDTATLEYSVAECSATGTGGWRISAT